MVRRGSTLSATFSAPPFPKPRLPKPGPILDMRGQLPHRQYAPPYHSRPLAGIVGATIHYTAGSPTASVRDVALYQVGPNAQEAFPEIAYTFVVPLDGVPVLCHSLDVRCWHSGAVIGGVSRNVSHVGICWVGNTVPTEAQIEGLRAAVRWCADRLGRELTVEGHREAPYATQCPGARYLEWLPRVRDYRG